MRVVRSRRLPSRCFHISIDAAYDFTPRHPSPHFPSARLSAQMMFARAAVPRGALLRAVVDKQRPSGARQCAREKQQSDADAYARAAATQRAERLSC